MRLINLLKKIKIVLIQFTFIFLIFNLQILAKADNIRDFQIEGISIGDKLLDYIDIDTINNSRKYEYDSDKFYTIDLILNNFKNYDAVQIHLKSYDDNYIIYGIGGAIKYGKAGIFFPASENLCKKQKKIIEKDIEKIFNNPKKRSVSAIGQGDYDPEVKRHETYYTFSNGNIYLQCATWGREAKSREFVYDSLRLTLINLEFSNWIETEAYQ